MNNKKWYATGIVIVGFLLACGGTEPSEEDINRLNDVANGGATTTNSTTPAKKEMGSGTWEIGKKEDLNARIITLGTYVITTPADGFYCYWTTLRNFSGEGNYIIKAGTVEPGASSKVTITKSAKGIELHGDCVAKKQK